MIDRLAAYATRESDLEKELAQQQHQQHQQQQHEVPSEPYKRIDNCVDQTNHGAKDAGHVNVDDANHDGTASDKENKEMDQVDLDVEEQCIETDLAQHNNENIDYGGASDGEIVNGIPSNVELFKMFWEQIIVFVEVSDQDYDIKELNSLLFRLGLISPLMILPNSSSRWSIFAYHVTLTDWIMWIKFCCIARINVKAILTLEEKSPKQPKRT